MNYAIFKTCKTKAVGSVQNKSRKGFLLLSLLLSTSDRVKRYYDASCLIELILYVFSYSSFVTVNNVTYKSVSTIGGAQNSFSDSNTVLIQENFVNKIDTKYLFRPVCNHNILSYVQEKAWGISEILRTVKKFYVEFYKVIFNVYSLFLMDFFFFALL